MSKDATRFRDAGETLADMLDEIVVVCARCERDAQVLPFVEETDKKVSVLWAKRRLICVHCGLVKEWQGAVFGLQPQQSPVCAPYFDAILWFQMECCGQTLWAWNRRHLALLEAYIAADLREKQFTKEYGYVSAGMINKLPHWMKVAKHREAILSDIAKLKRKYSEEL